MPVRAAPGFGCVPKRAGGGVSLAVSPRIRGNVAAAAATHARSMNNGLPQDILSFWLESPATTGPELMHKLQRWYVGSPALDREIDRRFGEVIERALEGGYEEWVDSPRGTLALIVVLDQLARNVHRGTARAHAGDARALKLALWLLKLPEVTAFNLEERLFAMMPLVHAEDPQMQDRAVELAEQIAAAAEDEDLRAVWSMGAGRTKHYREIIRRFGRFPHRNVALGRPSSAEELAFLQAAEVAPAPPAR